MADRDYYEVLGVARDADEKTLKSAFRKLAVKHHPDKNPGDAEAEQRFKDVNEAYDILKDPEKRAAYDRFGHAAFQGGGPGAAGGGRGFGGFGGFSDIFDEIFQEFGGARRGGGSGGAGRGADLRFDMEISLEDAFAGKQATVRAPSTETCDVCEGTGAAPGTKPVTCGTCRGSGKVRAQQGFFTIERTCPTCGGVGRVIETPCEACGGAGRTRRDKTLQVAIPAGVEDGTRIRLAGEGEAGLRGGPPGDLYLFLTLTPHPVFQREAADIYCRVPIPMTRAALGGQIEAPTIDGGRARIAIPKGAQTGQQFRLRGKGMSILRSDQRGDMYVEIRVETPMNLTRRQEELLRAFEAECGGDTSPESEGFFARVRDLWDDLRD